MDFYDMLDHVVTLLQQRKRMTYGALKLQFNLDDEHLQVLKEELIDRQQVAIDEGGKVLVWKAPSETPVSAPSAPSVPQSPASYMPPHLAERICAEHAAMKARGSADGERKTITALFADLKGSTALIERLDTKDLQEAKARLEEVASYKERGRNRKRNKYPLPESSWLPDSFSTAIDTPSPHPHRNEEVETVRSHVYELRSPVYL